MNEIIDTGGSVLLSKRPLPRQGSVLRTLGAHDGSRECHGQQQQGGHIALLAQWRMIWEEIATAKKSASIKAAIDDCSTLGIIGNLTVIICYPSNGYLSGWNTTDCQFSIYCLKRHSLSRKGIKKFCLSQMAGLPKLYGVHD